MRSKLWFVFVFTTLVSVSTQQSCGTVVTDFAPHDCPSNTFFQEPEGETDRCFPGCVENYDIHIIQCDPRPCPLGYECPEGDDERYCIIKEDSCYKYCSSCNRNDEQNMYNNAYWKPSCNADGKWLPKQCKGELNSGRCFCFGEAGKRIFGQASVKDSKDMTCACSRRREQFKKRESKFYSTLHCDGMGNFEALQCSSGQCWCMDPKTSKITAPFVPEGMMRLLPCYLAEKVGDQYLRQCESQQYAQDVIRRELKQKGTEYVSFAHIECDPDGSYGAYQIASGEATCRWRDNTQLGSYRLTNLDNLSNLTCNCARDSKMYESQGLQQSLACVENGNYNALQKFTNGLFYCVDEDGFAKSEMYDSAPDCSQFK